MRFNYKKKCFVIFVSYVQHVIFFYNFVVKNIFFFQSFEFPHDFPPVWCFIKVEANMYWIVFPDLGAPQNLNGYSGAQQTRGLSIQQLQFQIITVFYLS